MTKRARAVLFLLIAGGVVAYLVLRATRPEALVLTGIVTTDDVIVSPLVTGQLRELSVKEGDEVKRDQLLAVLASGELQADQSYYASSAKGFAGQILEGEAALRYQERQTEQQIRQAEATLAQVMAQKAEADANLDNAVANARRIEVLSQRGGTTAQDIDQSKNAVAVASARVNAMVKQIDAQKANVSLARANAEQVTVKRSVLATSKQQEAAAAAQAEKAQVRLGYTEIRAPIAGTIDVRAARSGEVVSAGQPIVTIVNPDDLWVRADIEETYIARIKLGDCLTVRLPSGDERAGTVFYRGVDAGFATQRDVSRTKRDIKTFEIRLRVDNHDRRLAVGMTAYVLLPAS